MGGEGELGHLIEEYSAAVGLLEVALTGIHSPGKGPLLMAEELAVDGALRDRAAVHGYIFLVFAGAELMYDFREKLLAGAAFARH